MTILGVVLPAMLLPGYARAASPENNAQIKAWRTDGRLAAGPWKETVRFGANTSNVELLWVRHDRRGGLVFLVPVDNAARSTLGAKAAADPKFATWASKPWTQISETSRSRLPDGCFTLGKTGNGVAVTTAAGTRTFPASDFRLLPEERVLLFGASVGSRGLHPGSQALVLDRRGAVAASAKIPAGSQGRFDFVGPFLVSVRIAGKDTEVAVLDPATLSPVLAGQAFALVLNTSFGADRDFAQLVVRDPTAEGEAAKLVVTADGPIELPMAWDRLRPYQQQGERLVPFAGGGAVWTVDAWLAEREGAIVAVLGRDGRLLAGGLKSAEPVAITGFVRAAGTPASVPGFVVCDTRGEWRVVWLDGVEPSPPMAQRDWALGGARTQRGKLIVQSINENNRRAIAATQTALAEEAARRAEAARLQAVAESQAKDYGQRLETFEAWVAQKQPGQALAVADRLERAVMHRIYPQRWEQAVLAGAKQALAAKQTGVWVGFRALLAAIPMHPGSEPAKTLAALDAKIHETILRRDVPVEARNPATAPASFVRELPGDAMRAMYGAMRREMESAGARYYGP